MVIILIIQLGGREIIEMMNGFNTDDFIILYAGIGRAGIRFA